MTRPRCLMPSKTAKSHLTLHAPKDGRYPRDRNKPRVSARTAAESTPKRERKPLFRAPIETKEDVHAARVELLRAVANSANPAGEYGKEPDITVNQAACCTTLLQQIEMKLAFAPRSSYPTKDQKRKR